MYLIGRAAENGLWLTEHYSPQKNITLTSIEKSTLNLFVIYL